MPYGTGTVTCQKVGTGTLIIYDCGTEKKMVSQKALTNTQDKIVVFDCLHLTFFYTHFTINLMKLINFFLVKKFGMLKGEIFSKILFENCAFYGLDMELEP